MKDSQYYFIIALFALVLSHVTQGVNSTVFGWISGAFVATSFLHSWVDRPRRLK